MVPALAKDRQRWVKNGERSVRKKKKKVLQNRKGSSRRQFILQSTIKSKTQMMNLGSQTKMERALKSLMGARDPGGQADAQRSVVQLPLTGGGGGYLNPVHKLFRNVPFPTQESSSFSNTAAASIHLVQPTVLSHLWLSRVTSQRWSLIRAFHGSGMLCHQWPGH